MSNRLFAALLILSVCPLVLLGWLSASAIRAEETRAKQTLEAYFQQSLSAVAAKASELVDSMEAELLAELDLDQDLAAQLGNLRRHSPLVKSAFWIAKDGTLLYPEIPRQVDTGRAEDLITIDQLVRNRPVSNVGELLAKDNSSAGSEAAWMSWYQQQGLQLVLWIPLQRGGTVGILLDRTAWISRLISSLPDSQFVKISSGPILQYEDIVTSTRTRLVDAQNQTIYQWGEGLDRFDEAAEWYPLAEIPLTGPLSAWRIRYESAAPMAISKTSVLPLIVGLAGIGMLLLLLGAYVATSMRREIRLAAQHVTFSGQVSHELRTPLTNIRLYTEMALEEISLVLSRDPGQLSGFSSAIDATLPKVQSRLRVIEQETDRLSRLCANVLELLRQPHQSNLSKVVEVDVDCCVRHIVDQFRPALEKADVSIEVELETLIGDKVRIDREALEMVVVNLVSNVEKYALDGKWLRISGQVTNGRLMLSVEDHGCGIPFRKREAIFRPFVRLDSSVNAPSGTGIGLSIARQAARRARGELRLVPSARSSNTNQGAKFELELPVDENSSR